METVSKRTLLFIASFLCLLLAACGGGGSSSGGQTVLSQIVVSPGSATIPKGGSQQFKATGQYSNGTSQDLTASVSWSSSNSSVAAISSSGTATGATEGGATIQAAFQGVKGSASLTVGAAALASLAVTPATASVELGLTQQFTATGTYTDGSTQNLTSSVTWSAANPSIASVTSSGLANSLAQGSTAIQAASGSITSSGTLNVGAPGLVSIAVTPNSVSLEKGQSQQLTATGTYTNGSQQNLTSQVTWSSTNSSVASVVAGLVTANNIGSASINAALSGLQSGASVTVSPPGLVSIVVTPANQTIPKGLTQQFTATGMYTDQSQQNLTNVAQWASSNINVAQINSAGLATGVGQGSATISATYTGISGNTGLTVGPPALVSIAVTPNSAQVPAGETQQFMATGTYTDNSQQNITNSVSWMSSNNNIVTINAAGLATGVTQGGVTITAALSGISGTASLTVTAPVLVSINVTPANQTLPLGSTLQYTATGVYSDQSQQNLTSQANWASTNTNIAMVENTPAPGLATGEGVGNCNIQATYQGITGSTQLTVQSGAQLTVTVLPPLASVTLTQTQQYSATVQGTTNQNVTWAVDGITGGNPSVGTISTTGFYTPPSVAAQHSITATSQADPTYSGSATIWVTDFAGTFEYRNDQQSTGQNLQEASLSAQTVNFNDFGKIFSCPLDQGYANPAYAYAQPLYIANLPIAGGVHNVLIVTTENDNVYAFDADNPSCEILWGPVSLLTNGGTPIPYMDLGNPNIGCVEIYPQLGTTGTPVIDLANNEIFMIAASLEGSSGNPSSYIHRLHALNLLTGQEMAGSPVQISATVPGTGAGSINGMLSFDGSLHKSRTGMELVNGVLYFGFSGNCDYGNFHGWVFAYDESNLSQLAVLATTPNNTDGGVWMGNTGISFDSNGNMYFSTGNGGFDANLGGIDYGDTVLKTALTGNSFSVLDSFTPASQENDNIMNLDVGSGGILILPDQPGTYPHLAVTVGKPGDVYVLDRDDLGGYNPNGDLIVQELQGAVKKNFNPPAYWNNNVYFCASGDVVKAFLLTNGLLSASPISMSTQQYFFPGCAMSISSSSATATAGILWTVNVNLFATSGPEVLVAYDATNLGNELYDSTQAGNNRDQAGPAVKFTIPTVANGKVYIGSQTELDVYGFLPGQPQKRGDRADSQSTAGRVK